MRVLIRSMMTVLMTLPLGLASCPAGAQEPSPMPAIKADRWAEAQAIAARYADPVAEKLVLYMRLRSPGAATAEEIAAFMRQNPDWPAQSMLERRREDAIATDPDDAAVLAQCRPNVTPASPAKPFVAAAMLRCAEATANTGRASAANDLARDAWVNAIDDPNTEAAFLRRWGGIATPADQWARFLRLAWTDPTAAFRQMGNLDALHQNAALIRLAAKREDPLAVSQAAALPADLRNDPGLVYDLVRTLNQGGALKDAATLLGKTTAPDHEAAFWAERNVLARNLLAAGDPKTAYAVAADNHLTRDDQKADAEFLAGFIALRFLHNPDLAEPHFAALAASHAAITQGRAHYWLGRTEAAAGRDPKPEYRLAAAWPTTFYGQLAALALGETTASRIDKAADPAWNTDIALAFTGHEVLRAAAWLIAWGEHDRARAFLMQVDENSPIPAERALTAAFALRTGMPDSAVFIARRMGRDGIALPRMGWPTPYTPPGPPDEAFSLGIMRQESSFDIGAVSPSGARGLMQLMPGTAQQVGRQMGAPVSLPSLTVDAARNMRLGTAYLQQVLTRFDDCIPMAAAAYNAGPGRVTQWLAANGDPRVGPVDMVDWIELIPFNETRNYVQRVVENATIYRAREHNDKPILANIPWSR
jgi:soluble lytic murein transglycosylase